jgi:hypothetical protein
MKANYEKKRSHRSGNIRNYNDRNVFRNSTFDSLENGESMIKGLIPDQKIKITIQWQRLKKRLKKLVKKLKKG